MAKPRIVLAFSVGGAIAWRAIQAGLVVDQLYAVSATRLRYETAPLRVQGRLYFGEEDPYTPNPEWRTQQTIAIQMLAGEQHECYQKQSVAELICTSVLEWKSGS